MYDETKMRRQPFFGGFIGHQVRDMPVKTSKTFFCIETELIPALKEGL